MENLIESIRGTINNWWVYLLSGILLIITGIIVLWYPGESYLGLSIVFGVLLFVIGIMRTATAAASRAVAKDWGWNLAFGIIEIILGLILMIHPGITAITLPFIFGFWLLLAGVYLIAFSFQLKDHHMKGWGWFLAGAIITIIFSLLVIFNPGAGAFSIIFFIAFGLISSGIFYLVLAFRLRSIKKDMEK